MRRTRLRTAPNTATTLAASVGKPGSHLRPRGIGGVGRSSNSSFSSSSPQCLYGTLWGEKDTDEECTYLYSYQKLIINDFACLCTFSLR